MTKSKLGLSQKSAESVIYKSVSVLINFSCNYDTVYDNIESNNITITGETTQSETNGKGKFNFRIDQFTDKTYATAVSSNHQVKVGKHLFFQLSMENPIPSLFYSIIGKCILSI